MKNFFLRYRAVCYGLLVGALLTVTVGAFYGVYQFGKTARVWELYQEDRLSVAGIFFMRGNYFFGGGAYDLALAKGYFNRALTYSNTYNEPIHYQIGRVHFIEGDLDTAIEHFNKQIELNPYFIQSYYMRGLTYGYQEKFTEAEQDFLTFIDAKPESWAAHNDLVWVYFRSGQYDKAEEYARRGLLHQPQNPWLNNALGGVLINQKRFKEAIAPLAIARDGFNAMTEADWGIAYPGNDPRVYREGRAASIRSAEENLLRAESVEEGE